MLLRLLLVLVIVGGAIGAALHFFGTPTQLQAFQLPFGQRLSTPKLDVDMNDVTRNADTKIANFIRSAAAGNLQLPHLSIGDSLTSLGSSTISASVAVTPAEMMRLIQEKGPQAALGEIVSRIQVQAGNMSVNAVSEARYQYCVGVVKDYKERQE